MLELRRGGATSVSLRSGGAEQQMQTTNYVQGNLELASWGLAFFSAIVIPTLSFQSIEAIFFLRESKRFFFHSST